MVQGKLLGELPRRSVQKNLKNVRLLGYNNHICYVSHTNAVFQSFRCQRVTLSVTTSSLERYSTICSE